MQDKRIDCTETIGRRVFSKSLAEKLLDGLSPNWSKVRSSLAPSQREHSVSADRLDGADCFVLTKIHDATALQRAQPSESHGWLCCKACAFKTLGGTVCVPGATENPDHCSVVLVLQGRRQVLDFLSSIPIGQL